ncbi:MAG TPA: hypothetical protein VE549_13905 [Myxococcaceae bacterium]|jgi:hypothetical protein|nr:hypothetical protein [Myxococcaceae bacterium]
MTQLNVTGEHPARAGHPARAVVHAAGVSTEYLRVGRGDVIVFVTEDLESDETRSIVEKLQSCYTVLAAVPALTRHAHLMTWFNDFLEGLGVQSAHLLLHSSMTMTIASGELSP